MKLLGRIIVEKRVVVIPIALGLALNLAAYLFYVYPLQSRVASGQAHMLDATRAQREAERDLAAARAVQAGRQSAQTQLADFYARVLPGGSAAARRAAYLRLAQLAAESNVRYLRQSAAEDLDKKSGLTRLSIQITLDGGYQDVRRFIHAIETAPEFLIVNQVALSGKEGNAPLALTLQMSTFFRTGGNAT